MSELVGRTLESLAETKGSFVSAVKNMKNISDIADKQHLKDKLANAYSTIKEALVGGLKFVEIKL